ncbi:MAG: rhodanese-like domain-containing protein [Paracoccaceae bacterium]
MTLTLKDMMQAANAAVERIDAVKAQEIIASGGVMIDLRDGVELQKTGKAIGAIHISRGLLEFKADPDSPAHDPELRKDRAIVLHCASGGRAALAGKLLMDMGFEQVYNLGGFNDWVQGGGDVS